MNKSIVSIVNCKEYSLDLVKDSIEKVLENIGGLKSFVKKGDKVLLKVNMLSAKPPDRAITTHPTIVEALCILIKEIGAIPKIGDSPGGNITGIDRYYKETQFFDVAQRQNVELLNFEKLGSKEVKIENEFTDSLNITKAIDDVDLIINLPKLKTHGLTLYTGAVKNLYGLIPGLSKAYYHKLTPNPDTFSTIICDLFGVIKPQLSIMDGIIGMEGNGPSSGDPREIGILIASKDAVAIDSVASSLIGYKPMDIESTRLCNELGHGNGKLENIEIISETPYKDLIIKDFKLPSNAILRKLPNWLLRIFSSQLWIKPIINTEKCIKCQFCLKNCPVKTIHTLENKDLFVEHSKCISCLCCHELCPYDAIDLERSWLAKIMFKSSFKKEQEKRYNFKVVEKLDINDFNRLYINAPLRHKLEYKLFSFFMNLANKLPKRSFYAIGSLLGDFVYYVLRMRVNKATEQLKQRIPEISNEKSYKRIIRRSYENFGKFIMEYIGFNRINKENIDDYVSIKGIENLDAALKKKKGVILLTAHYGSWELLGLTLALKGYNIDYLVGEQKNLLVNFWMNYLRNTKGIGIIYRGMALRGVLGSLRKNRIVALLSDQDAGKEGVFVDYFNEKASTPKGTALFAMKSGAQILPMFIERKKGNKNIIHIEKPVEYENHKDKEKTIKDITQKYTKEIEKHVRKNPDHWFWAHRRWKTRPEDLD